MHCVFQALPILITGSRPLAAHPFMSILPFCRYYLSEAHHLNMGFLLIQYTPVLLTSSLVLNIAPGTIDWHIDRDRFEDSLEMLSYICESFDDQKQDLSPG